MINRRINFFFKFPFPLKVIKKYFSAIFCNRFYVLKMSMTTYKMVLIKAQY